jgi:hypothetical protein
VLLWLPVPKVRWIKLTSAQVWVCGRRRFLLSTLSAFILLIDRLR